MNSKAARKPYQEAFRDVCQRRKAGPIAKYIAECITIHNFDEVCSPPSMAHELPLSLRSRCCSQLDICMDSMDNFQIPILAEAIGEVRPNPNLPRASSHTPEAAGLGSINATVGQRPEKGCRGTPTPPPLRAGDALASQGTGPSPCGNSGAREWCPQSAPRSTATALSRPWP
jgi:hypothetical protein